MGKGFNNYMCKKFFHPASRDNLKRVWMAQQKDDAYKKKQEELRDQYEKEQDLYNNKAMLSKESKDKLSVNFMYEPPPGAKKEREKEENEQEYKFEWQRKYNAPREDYCKGNSEIQDQPFGILVRNVRCIKCRKWGHINTDKECPLYNQSVTSEIAKEGSDALSLLRGMREDGLRMRKTALDAQQHVEVPKFRGMVKDEEEQGMDKAELEFLKALSTKEKLKLLKKLEKLESGGKKKHKSDSDDRRRIKKAKKKKDKNDTDNSSKKKKKTKKHSSSSEESDDSAEEFERKRKKKYISEESVDSSEELELKRKKKYISEESDDSSVELEPKRKKKYISEESDDSSEELEQKRRKKKSHNLYGLKETHKKSKNNERGKKKRHYEKDNSEDSDERGRNETKHRREKYDEGDKKYRNKKRRE